MVDMTDTGPFELRIIEPGTPEYAEAAEIRYDALYSEWNLPRSLIEDTDGRTYRHVAAFDPEGRVIGYARIWLEQGESKVFQVTVDRAWRECGVGAALVRELMRMAAQAGRSEVVLDARAHVVGFYERFGFVAEGEEFLSPRTGTPHRVMRAPLAGCGTND